MTDIESLVTDRVAEALQQAFGDTVSMQDESAGTPRQFPCVCLYESDNRDFRETEDAAPDPTRTEVFYQVDVYTDNQPGGRQQAKDILSAVDLAMQAMKFTRRTSGPVPDADPAFCRRMAQYSAVVSFTGGPDETTVCQMYRR